MYSKFVAKTLLHNYYAIDVLSIMMVVILLIFLLIFVYFPLFFLIFVCFFFSCRFPVNDFCMCDSASKYDEIEY